MKKSKLIFIEGEGCWKGKDLGVPGEKESLQLRTFCPVRQRKVRTLEIQIPL
jgi:hypothetical protein